MKRVLCILEDTGSIKGERIIAHFSTAGELAGITCGRVELEASLLSTAED